jgi:hypothetical protein
MPEEGENSAKQASDAGWEGRRLWPRRGADWATWAVIGLFLFAFAIAPMLYIAALAWKFGGLWLDGLGLLVMVGGYAAISLGVRITRVLKRRKQTRQGHHLGSDQHPY